MYRLIDVAVVKARGNTDDVYNRVASAGLAGVAFKCTGEHLLVQTWLSSTYCESVVEQLAQLGT